MTYLTQAEVDGEPLTDEVIIAICDLIMAGGFDTTTAATANALMHLHQNPEDRRRLDEDRTLLKPATEEFLRFFSPTQGLARTVTQDVEVAGQQLRAGDRLFLSWASANHDDTVFERPEDVVLDRRPNRHTAFGVGAHRCLGAPIARIEIEVMLDAVLTRLPYYRIDEERARRYTSIGIVNGWITMPATFTPGRPIGTDVLPGS